ncbi:strigolactone esterase D14 [Rutidosis leptorrhynchoides]|uniref:strigolactone esterase D14 n=1 Tax=Rutidosis leptorrhynchoides TaxID=125765 RepID=UPI003A9A47F5
MVIKQEKSLSTTMNAKIIGSGKETMILAHGYGGDQSLWDKVLPILTQTYQVVVFDWCFSGAIKEPNTLFDPSKHTCYDAFSEDLINLLQELSLDSTVFVGHSMSGMIGCIASVKKPHLFKKLILVSPSPRYLNSEFYEGGFDLKDLEQLFTSIESNYNEWASFFPSLVIDKNDPESLKVFEKCLKRMNPEIGLLIAKTVFLSDHRDILEKVAIPCTIIQTTNDIVVPISVVEYMKKTIKGESTVEMIDTLGHFPQLTAPNQFLEIIDRVMNVELSKTLIE